MFHNKNIKLFWLFWCLNLWTPSKLNLNLLISWTYIRPQKKTLQKPNLVNENPEASQRTCPSPMLLGFLCYLSWFYFHFVAFFSSLIIQQHHNICIIIIINIIYTSMCFFHSIPIKSLYASYQWNGKKKKHLTLKNSQQEKK